jgi:cysteine synthase A
MRSFGAEVVLVAQKNGRPGHVTGDDIGEASRVAREIAARQGAYFVDQFNNPGSIAAHRDGTGPEILRELGRVDAFVSTVGTGGTFVGVALALKHHDPRTLCIAVEPSDAEVLAGKPLVRATHLLQGTSYGIVPPHWRNDLMDGAVGVSDEDTVKWRVRLGLAGLHVGFSSAANVCAAARLLRQRDDLRGASIVTLLADTGFKYLD